MSLPERPIQARLLRVHHETAADGATLATSVQTWLDGRSEEEVVDVQFVSATEVFIIYTE